MKKIFFLAACVLTLVACNKKQEINYNVDKFYDLEVLRYDVPDFDQLTLQ